MAGTEPGMVDLGRLPGDTVPERRWRVVVDGAVLRLECQAMVPGGWKEVAVEPDERAIRRMAGWMGLTIETGALAPEHREAA